MKLAQTFVIAVAIARSTRYTGRTSKFGNLASMESLACGCCGEALSDQLIRLDLAEVRLVRAFLQPLDPAR
jgi:hypothetical protein